MEFASSKKPRSNNVSASSAMNNFTLLSPRSILSAKCQSQEGVAIKTCVLSRNSATSSYDLGIKAFQRNLTLIYFGA